MKPYYEKNGISVFHGDCAEVLSALEADSVQVSLTDPPWEVSATGIEIRGTGVAPRKQASRSIKAGTVGSWSSSVVEDLQRVVANDLLILAGYKELGRTCELQKPLRGVFGWHKPNGAPGMVYPAKLDLSFIVWGGKKSLLYGHQHWPSMVFSYSFPSAGCFASERFVDASGKAIHPCQSPLALYLELLRPFAKGTTVIDPYMGTGTTLEAAKRLGLKCIGVEREERYVEIAVRRLAQEVLPFV